MKSTPAVFLISLAVSAISITVPLPTASTVLHLLTGEDITAEETTKTKEKTDIDKPKEPTHTESPVATIDILRDVTNLVKCIPFRPIQNVKKVAHYLELNSLSTIGLKSWL